ncbi:hypothetical protein N7449_001660 [Penicillium cf. viridicatum]|uniref:Uncharacterized protein n=1 Tax=Penicillium cf. viridicatum TaxID=2972119 RepID=A0A9W9T9N5_9EURO|nr:hypothetical protein N7449_001660 [Penicillium cf. viridicatum]
MDSEYTTSNTGNCGGCGAVCVVGSPPTCCDGVCTDLSSSVDNCGACDAPTFQLVHWNPTRLLFRALVKYQPVAQAPVSISPMIPSTVVLAMNSPVLDSRLAAVRAHVLISRLQLLIAVHAVIFVTELRQLAALGLVVT